jgi:hypothetical protein
MAKLYRGVCLRLDVINKGLLIPKGTKNQLTVAREKRLLIRGEGLVRGMAVCNALQAHHIDSSEFKTSWISFSLSKKTALGFAIRDWNFDEPTDGYIYEIDESLFELYEVEKKTAPTEKYKEQEVLIRALNNTALPAEIITSKIPVTPDDINFIL